MATTTKTEKTEEYVDLFVDRGQANDDPNFFISINGKNFILPKGKTSKVPKYVKDEYDRAMRAKEAFYARSEKLLEKANQPI